MRRVTVVVLLACLLLSAVLSSAQTFTSIPSNQPSVTVASLSRSTATAPSQLCYSYSTGPLTAQSDVSVILITNGNAGFANPTAYISTSASPPPTSATTSNLLHHRHGPSPPSNLPNRQQHSHQLPHRHCHRRHSVRVRSEQSG